MWQRIQTLYFLLALVCVALIILNPIAEFLVFDVTNVLRIYMIDIYSFSDVVTSNSSLSTSVIPFTALFSFIGTIILLVIFSFKKRKRQIRLSVFSLLLLLASYGLAYFYFYMINETYNVAQINMLFPVICPIIGVIFLYLGMRNTRKDEKLIRSVDRIR